MRENSNRVNVPEPDKIPCLLTTYGYYFRPLITNHYIFNTKLYDYYIPNVTDFVEELEDRVPGSFTLSYIPTVDLSFDSTWPNVLPYSYPTLVSFFSSQMIDIPLCLQTTNSLYFPVASSPQLQLINMLMRHGRKAYTSKCYTESLHIINGLRADRRELYLPTTDWRFAFGLFTQLKLGQAEHDNPNSKCTEWRTMDTLSDHYSQKYDESGHLPIGGRWLHDALFDELARYTPIFSFYVKKVDKSKRKNSRGKTGKYSISWKYVPQYRRIATVLRWLSRDVRFQNSKTFRGRILKSLETLLFDTTTHLVYQLRQFVHTFVFQNHKKTLVRTLRAS